MRKSKIIDFKKMALLSLMLVLTTLLTVGGTWLFTSLGSENISTTNEAHISSLEKQLAQLREVVKTKEVFEKNNQALGAPTATN